MTAADANAISRKIEGARNISSPIPRMNEVLGWLTKYIEKHGRAYLGSVVEAMILDHEIKTFSDVLDQISMPALIGIVEADGKERAALMNLDLDLVYHIVDLRMGGMPTELPDFVARRPTSIDWAMCQPVVEMALEGFSYGLSESFGRPRVVDMTCSHFEHLPMLCNIVDDHADVLCVQVSLDIGEAARSGNFELVIPLALLDAIKSSIGKAYKVEESSVDAWAEHMLDAVLQTPLEITPVLHRTNYSVAELSRLKVGQVLPLDADAHQAVQLQVSLGDDVTTLAQGRLGALKGAKALKLTSDLDPDFLAPLRAAAQRGGHL